jgi:hypothetical protein
MLATAWASRDGQQASIRKASRLVRPRGSAPKVARNWRTSHSLSLRLARIDSRNVAGTTGSVVWASPERASRPPRAPLDSQAANHCSAASGLGLDGVACLGGGGDGGGCCAPGKLSTAIYRDWCQPPEPLPEGPRGGVTGGSSRPVSRLIGGPSGPPLNLFSIFHSGTGRVRPNKNVRPSDRMR